VTRDIWLVGIGTGSLAHITQEGLDALRRAAAILVPQKGEDKDELAEIRRRIIAESGSNADVVPFDYPVRNETLPDLDRVEHWHDEIAGLWKGAIGQAAPGPVALLVWGDPGLYDSTLRIASRLVPRAQIRVVPGITALQALTAAHAIPLSTVNGEVLVTTGRRLRDRGWPKDAITVAVMLDGQCSFQSLDPDGLRIWWGAYLGMAHQVLVEGRLAEVGPQIVTLRQEVRAQHGWIMDTYLLRKNNV
jgi:precorrin-6A synthase